MSLPSQAAINQARSLIKKSLRDSVTITRSNVTYACRIRKGQGVYSLTPATTLSVPLWDIIFDYDADVQEGDQGNAPSGLYSFIQSDSGKTNDVARNISSVREKKGDGTWDVPLTETVTFRRGTNPHSTITIGPKQVSITPAADAPPVAGQTGMFQYDWYIVADPALLYPAPDNGPIESGDVVLWSKALRGMLIVNRAIKTGWPFDRYIIFASES